jgi:hypothetical protein
MAAGSAAVGDGESVGSGAQAARMTSEIKQRLYNDLDIFFIETSSFFF